MESKKTITELLDPRDLPADLYAELIRSPGSIHYDAGKIYLLAAQKVISFPDNAAGRELAETLRSDQSGADSSNSVKTDAFFRLLTGGTSPSDPIPDALRASRSRAVVVSGGNEGNAEHHYGGVLGNGDGRNVRDVEASNLLECFFSTIPTSSTERNNRWN